MTDEGGRRRKAMKIRREAVFLSIAIAAAVLFMIAALGFASAIAEVLFFALLAVVIVALLGVTAKGRRPPRP
jgi:hypothetical protein